MLPKKVAEHYPPQCAVVEVPEIWSTGDYLKHYGGTREGVRKIFLRLEKEGLIHRVNGGKRAIIFKKDALANPPLGKIGRPREE